MDRNEIAEVARRLREPFDPTLIGERTIGGGGKVDYLPINIVIDRLNEVAVSWSFEVRREWMDGNVLKALVALTVPGLGTREHIGVQRIVDKESNDDSNAKGHISDGLKKAATLFGVRIGDASGGGRSGGNGPQRGNTHQQGQNAPTGHGGGSGQFDNLDTTPGSATKGQIDTLWKIINRRNDGLDDRIYDGEGINHLEELSKARASEIIGQLMKK